MPQLRYPGVEGTFDAPDRTVAHWCAGGWEHVDAPKPKRSRKPRKPRPRTPRPVSAGSSDDSIAGASATTNEE